MTDVGTRIVARYELDALLPPDLRAVTAWSATDQVLGRPVRVLVLNGNHVAQTLDAARRAALLSDPRLTRVLDVGIETVPALDAQPAQEIDYVVCEPRPGQTLTEIVAAHGPLDAQQARAIVGEAASALETARRRGLHHWALRPSVVSVDGPRVAVSGMGVDGPVSGLEDHDGNVGSRRDARDLVALLYFLLTGLWPSAAPEPSWVAPGANRVPHAPGDSHGPALLSSLAPDASADLVTLCADTLGVAQSGPQTPGDVVDSLAPWHAIRPIVSPTTAASTATVSDPPAPTVPGGPVRTPVFGAQKPVAAPVRVSTHLDRAPAAAPAVAFAAVPPAGASAAAPPPSTVGPSAVEPQAPKQATSNHGFDPTRLVLGLFAAVVAVGAVLGIVGVTTGYEPAFIYKDQQQPAAAPQPSSNPSDDAGTNQPAAPAPADVRPVIAKGAQVDPPPDGDNNEHPEAAGNAYDGDLDTYWFSRTYSTPQFGGLKKGIGYAITLEKAAPVSTIVLDTNNTGGHIEVRATTPDDPTGGSVLAEGKFEPETTLTFSQPVTSKTFVLWFDELPQTKDGKNRIELNEIQIS